MHSLLAVLWILDFLQRQLELPCAANQIVGTCMQCTFEKINCCALTFKFYLQNSLGILSCMVILIILSKCCPIVTLHVQALIFVLSHFLSLLCMDRCTKNVAIFSLLFLDRCLCFDQECSLIMQVQISV